MGITSKRFFVDGTAGHMTDYMVSIPKKETDVKPFRIKKVKRIKNGQKKDGQNDLPGADSGLHF